MRAGRAFEDSLFAFHSWEPRVKGLRERLAYTTNFDQSTSAYIVFTDRMKVVELNHSTQKGRGFILMDLTIPVPLARES